MSAIVSSNTTTPNHQDTRSLLSMTPPPRQQSDRERAGSRIRTLLDLLITDKMDASDRATRDDNTTSGTGSSSSRWRMIRQRLGCCGAATWSYGSTTIDDHEEDGNDVVLVERVVEAEEETRQQGMNLAAALAAERQFRVGGEGAGAIPGTPMRVSLMRLLEETASFEGGVERDKGERDQEMVGNDRVCCVCMGREKGAALIPCGHTYCRVCSREVWLNRGSCPLCNRHILDILDIF